MSKEGEKATVFQTTKVRTKLRGDNSWMQRHSEPQPEAEAEKPWMAEVRASRLIEANVETSPVPSPTQSSPLPPKTNAERSPASGFIIRGAFVKTEKAPSPSNGYSGTTQFIKKPSETYKKIAPHTVRSTTEKLEAQLSQEEQEKRTEAAAGVLKKSAARQRSYVMSAAKMYESKDKTPDLLVNSTAPFVAQRVEINDEDESNTPPAPTSTTTTVTNVAPLPKPRTSVNTSSSQVEVKAEVKPEEVKVEEKAPEKDPFEDMVPGCTKVATPLPELIPDLVQAIYVKPDDSSDAKKPESPVVEPAPPSPASKTPAPAMPPPKSVTVESIVVETADVTVKTLKTVKAEPQPEIKVQLNPEPQLEPQGEPEDLVPVKIECVQISSDSDEPFVDTDTPDRLKEKEPLQLVNLEPQKMPEVEVKKEAEPLKEEEPLQPVVEHTVDNHAEDSVEPESTPAISNVEPLTDDLLGFNDSPPQELVQPVPPSSGPWSQDLLSPIESETPKSAKTSSIVDLLSNEDIVITETHSLSTQPEEKKPTDEAAKEAQSITETVTITTKTVIITDKSEEESADPLSSHVITTVTESSSTDPFDPYPIGTTSSNSSSDLLQPLTDISINSTSTTSVKTKGPSLETNSKSSSVLDSLSDDIIPIKTEATNRLSTHRSWARTWDEPESTEESQEAEAEGQAEDQQTMIMFERKSKENDSPWDRWTSPTVYTISTNKEEDEEEESEMPEDTETQIITTVTTIREIHSEPEPSMDRTLKEPEPESKKPFVYVKEYVNTSELSLLNARDTDRTDYVTSTSTSYSYSSPSTYLSGGLSSKCTFCGEPVGSDAKITIDHLNINCHPECFKCGVCGKPMGDLLHKMFLHGGKVHCESCYRNA